MKLKYDSAGVSALDIGCLTCQDLYKHRRPTRTYVGHACTCCSVAATCMCTKLELLRFQMATCLALKLLHIQPLSGILLPVSGGCSRIGDGKALGACQARRRLKRPSCPLPAGLLSCFWGLPFPNITNGLLLYQDETARVVSRYHFWLSNRSALPLTSVPSCRN
jgi:hypothetical protein